MKNFSIVPRLTVVGAGPGDPDLITLKAIKALKKADVVLYDALANQELLDYAPTTAMKVYVGKRAGCHAQQQEEINRMIVDFAYNMGHVVRLKGGDPFVFGRGQEEMAMASKNGIQVDYVPGISSAIAVPGLAGISLTARGISQSFWVVTGTLADGSLSPDIDAAAQSGTTVVVLMGMNRLEKIVDRFLMLRNRDEPIALISNGSLPNQRMLISELSKIVEEQQLNPIPAPAIIVIGEVVRLSQDLAEVFASANVV
jgi:uroporphyrin-III C-methyltransferase